MGASGLDAARCWVRAPTLSCSGSLACLWEQLIPGLQKRALAPEERQCREQGQ